MNNLTHAFDTSQATPSATGIVDIKNIKHKMKATWSDGDYDTFSRYMADGAEAVVKQWQISKGEKVLDVACGSGQTAIPCARRGAIVTGIDIAQNTIEAARERAELDGVQVHFETGDAENIQFPASSYDVVISMYGAMFAPRPERVVEEFARVCRPGGRIHMANWTPQGMTGKMFKIIGRHISPPGVTPPVLWGDEETMIQRLSANFTDIQLTRKHYPKWAYPFDAPALVDFFRAYYGPIKRAFESLDAPGQQALHQELAQNFDAHNMATDGSLNLKGEYLDVTATRK